MFGPNIPATNAEATSAMFRGQFNGLKDLIDAIQTITAAQVDTVTTLPLGLPAGATVSVAGHTLNFGFELPQGPQGPPFSSAVVDAVNTVDPGTPAAVSLSFDGANVRFTFDIPKGSSGNDGGVGPQGIQGEPGVPGEVTNAQLDSAISGTSANSNSVAALGLTVSDPPTQGEMQAIANKLDELITALRR